MGSSFFPEEVLHRIRQEADIVRIVSDHVALKKSGQNWKGLCPFHSEKSPSFTVSPVKQFFHCFGCGAGGDVIGFLMKMEGVTFPQAVRTLAEQAGIPLPARGSSGMEEGTRVREEVFRIQKEAAGFFHGVLRKQPQDSPVKLYLSQRGVSPEMIREFSLGYAPAGWHHLQTELDQKGWAPEQVEKAGLITRKEGSQDPVSGKALRYYDRFRDRLIFPIFDLQRRVVGFGGRVIGEGNPKYLNSPETVVFSKGSQLYGFEKAREEAGKRGFLVIVEGYMDTLRLHQAGFRAVVATLGTALTEDHLKLVRRFVSSVKLVFDADEAGIRAALRAVDLLIPSPVSGEVVLLPPGEDPDSFVRKKGLGAFMDLLEKSEKILDFAITQGLSRQKTGSIEEKLGLVDRLLPVIRKIQRPIERNYYIKQLAEQLGLDETELNRELGGSLEHKNPSPKSSSVLLKENNASSPLPPEEKILVQLLIHNPSDISSVSREIRPDNFSDPNLKKVYSELLEHAKKGGEALGPAALLSKYSPSAENRPSEPDISEGGSPGGNSAEVRSAFPGLSGIVGALSLEEPDFEDSRQTLRDCVRTLRSKNIRSEMKTIEVKIRNAERTGNGSLIKTLQTELIDLKKRAMDINVLS